MSEENEEVKENTEADSNNQEAISLKDKDSEVEK